jgi:hypothetical protein
MGCDSSKHFDDVYKNDSVSEEGDENKNNNKKKEERNEELSGKEGNKANKDNRKNKKDQRKKRDMKNQKEFKLSDNDESISNSDSYKAKKALKKKLKSNTKKKEESESSEEEEINNNNREDNSNINTEGMATVETRKFNLKKNENEGLLIMDGIEDLFPEDLTEEDIYQLVEDALGDSIVENEENKVQGTITRAQARSVAKILYKKLKKKKGKYDIDISEYPELKGVNIKIGAGQLTKDVIKNMMFNEDDIDENQIEKTYKKLTKNSNDVKALTIELITDETDNK